MEKNVNTIIAQTTLNSRHTASVEINDPLIVDFYKALKRQKIFGLFTKSKAFKKLTCVSKQNALESIDFIEIGDLTITPDNSDFIKRLKIICAATTHNNYDCRLWHSLPMSEYLAAYAREYFKDKKLPLKHNQFYYQILFGAIFAIIGLIFIFGGIFYFWGIGVFSVVLGLFFTYICFVSYKLRKLNFF